MTEPCQLAVEFLHCTAGPCVALERADGRTYCGLVRHPAKYLFGEDMPQVVTGNFSSLLAGMLGLGMGCDAEDDS